MDMGLSGKWALVGGASKGLGFGCAQALAEAGVNLVVVARNAQTLAQAAHTLRHGNPVEVIEVATDITTAAGRQQALAARPGFDILVTNAGGPPPGDFRQWGRDDWLAAIDANMLTPIELIKAVVDGMTERGFGRIVNITSGAVKAPIDVLGLSNGARSGLTGFVAGLARQSRLASRNVTINNLLPGGFDTDRIRVVIEGAARKTGRSTDEILQSRLQTIPAGRLGNIREFGHTCAFLCSQQAGYITGQNILIDGGAYPGTF
jgi:3-oxoacyl-[acyl-carrier protein] reductase